eukprot:6185597-Pleurochrysis_carterae.AAC.1
MLTLPNKLLYPQAASRVCTCCGALLRPQPPAVGLRACAPITQPQRQATALQARCTRRRNAGQCSLMGAANRRDATARRTVPGFGGGAAGATNDIDCAHNGKYQIPHTNTYLVYETIMHGPHASSVQRAAAAASSYPHGARPDA